MIRIENSYLVHSPVDFVFAYIANPINDQYWQSACNGVELHDPGEKVGEGTRYSSQYHILGRDLHFHMQITAHQPQRRYACASVTGPLHYWSDCRFTRFGNSTQIDWILEVETGMCFSVIPDVLLQRALARLVQDDMGNLSQIVGARTVVWRDWQRIAIW